MNTLELMRKSIVIAQSLAPFDTGNLRYNAVHGYATPETGGFRIIVRYTAAYYGIILDEFPTINKRKNIHHEWFSGKVFNSLNMFIKGSLDYQNNAYQAANESVALYAENNDARIKRANQSMNPDAGREAFYAKGRR